LDHEGQKKHTEGSKTVDERQRPIESDKHYQLCGSGQRLIRLNKGGGEEVKTQSPGGASLKKGGRGAYLSEFQVLPRNLGRTNLEPTRSKRNRD